MSRRPQLDAAAVAVLSAFSAAGIEALLLKGPVLARVLYTPEEARAYSDVDLLVSERELPRARAALARLGYTSTSDIKGIDDIAGVLHAETWAPDGGPVTIDLHWRLAGCDAAAQAVWRALARRRVWLDLDGHPVPTLDRPGLALHLATHCAQGGSGDHKAIADLVRGLHRITIDDWRSAADLARELEATSAFAAGLRLIPAGAALARDLKLPATDATDWQIAHRAERPRGNFHLDALLRASGLREHATILRRALLPTPRWMAWNYRWVGASRLRLAAAYVLHMSRAPLWALRAALFRRRGRGSGG